MTRRGRPWFFFGAVLTRRRRKRLLSESCSVFCCVWLGFLSSDAAESKPALPRYDTLSLSVATSSSYGNIYGKSAISELENTRTLGEVPGVRECVQRPPKAPEQALTPALKDVSSGTCCLCKLCRLRNVIHSLVSILQQHACFSQSPGLCSPRRWLTPHETTKPLRCCRSAAHQLD